MDEEEKEEVFARLRTQLGKHISKKLLRELGDDFIGGCVTLRTCKICQGQYYAKGFCHKHYMIDRRVFKATVDQFGRRIGKRGIVLCDYEGCEFSYKLVEKTQGPDGKWYCSHHWQELFDKAKVPE